jgi:hypothetical protein
MALGDKMTLEEATALIHEHGGKIIWPKPKPFTHPLYPELYCPDASAFYYQYTVKLPRYEGEALIPEEVGYKRVKGHPYQSPQLPGHDLFWYHDAFKWCLSEGTTGMLVSSEYGKLADAIEKAEATIARAIERGMDFTARLRPTWEAHLSPRYRREPCGTQ